MNMTSSPLFSNGSSAPDVRSTSNDALSLLSSVALTEESINAAILHVRTLKSRRNSLLPISKLSAELLVRVFVSHSFQQPHGDGGRLGWITTTHVCRRWRQVALDNASLWTAINFNMGSKWAAEMLSRAGPRPLEVSLQGARSLGDWETVSHHLHHTRTMRLLYLHPEATGHITKILSMPAPILEELDIRFLDHQTSPNCRHLEVGNRLFTGQAPRLSRISLHRLANPWRFLPRGSLTTLHLVFKKSDLQKGTSTAISWENLMGFISDNQSIHQLSLDFCLPPPSSTWSLQHRAIELPRLHYLSLGGQGISVFKFLASIKFPQSVRLEVHSLSTRPTGADLHFLMALLSVHFGAPGSEPLQSFCLCFPGSSTKKLEIWARETSPQKSDTYSSDEYFTGWDELPRSRLHLTLESESEHSCDLRTFLRDVFFMLPIAKLKYLRLEVSDVFESGDWTAMFGRCTLVNDIEIMGRGFNTIAKALSTPGPPPATATPPVSAPTTAPTRTVVPPSITKPVHGFYLFPRFTRLSVAAVDLTRERAKNVPGHLLLEKLVTDRMRSDTPLTKVSILNCKFGPTRTQTLAKIRGTKVELEEDDTEPPATADRFRRPDNMHLVVFPRTCM
ncbi:hypothetical protein BC834DRAFT_889975 [Gloeopeniophorella convolvens]|nr:hypothetical protein BC834DRAFT_889975 [Gloeopeniophorella convolvens]